VNSVEDQRHTGPSIGFCDKFFRALRGRKNFLVLFVAFFGDRPRGPLEQDIPHPISATFPQMHPHRFSLREVACARFPRPCCGGGSARSAETEGQSHRRKETRIMEAAPAAATSMPAPAATARRINGAGMVEHRTEGRRGSHPPSQPGKGKARCSRQRTKPGPRTRITPRAECAGASSRRCADATCARNLSLILAFAKKRFRRDSHCVRFTDRPMLLIDSRRRPMFRPGMDTREVTLVREEHVATDCFH
jgi:hypothetical protein